MANNHENDQFVVHYDSKWAVRGGGNSKLTKIFDTQAEAKSYATKIAKNKQSVFLFKIWNESFISQSAMVKMIVLQKTRTIDCI